MARNRSSPKTKFLYLSRGILAVSCLLPILLVPAIVYRWILIKCAKRYRPDLAHMLRSHGSSFLQDSVHREPHMNLIVTYHFDGAPDFEILKKICGDRMVFKTAANGQQLMYPEFQQYCIKWGGYFFWKQEDVFDIDEHIRFHNLEPNGDIDLFRTNYLKEPLPECRSPWQILVVGGTRQPDGRRSHYIIFKHHHSLSDAYGISQAWMHMFDTPGEFLDPSKYNEVGTGYLRQVLYWITFPIRFILATIRLGATRTSLTEKIPWPRLPPEHMSVGGRKQHIYAGGGQVIEMEAVKRIAIQHGSSVTAVLYGAIAGALGRYLLSRYRPVEIPDYVSFLQAVPVPRHGVGLCNTTCTVTFQLPIGEPDQCERLRVCDRMIRNLKMSLESRVTLLVLQIRNLLPSRFPFLREFDSGWACISTTNVAGPLTPVQLNGQRALSIVLNVAVPPSTFYVAMVTYNGTLRWSCSGDTRVFAEEELKVIGGAILEEMESLGLGTSSSMKPEDSELAAINV